MKMVKCDGCDTVEDYVNSKSPDGFHEVALSISCGVAGEGTYTKYDLCSHCEMHLREQMQVRRWPRAGGTQ